MSNSINYLQLASSIKEAEPSLYFSSNRWVLDDCLQKSFYNDICCNYLWKKYPRLPKSLKKRNDIEELENDLGTLYLEDDFRPWPLAPIAIEALKLGPLEQTRELEQQLPFYDFNLEKTIIINRILFHPQNTQAFFILQGRGGSGKSTFLNLLCQLLDNDVAVADPATDFTGFRLENSIKCRLAACDDIQGSIFNSEKIKAICTGGKVKCEKKFGSTFDIVPQCKMIFLSNPLIYLDIGDSGLMRRVVWVEMNKRIENPIAGRVNRKYFHDDLLLLARFALSYDRRIDDSNWKDCFLEMTHSNVLKSSSIGQYFKANRYHIKQYQEYVDFCKENGYKPYNRMNYDKIVDTIREWEEEDGVNYGS